MANTNVAKKAEAKLPALSLDMMESDAHSGLENIQQDDLATPRLKILMQLCIFQICLCQVKKLKLEKNQ